ARLDQLVQLGIDETNSFRGVSQILIEQDNDAGQNGCGGRCATDDIAILHVRGNSTGTASVGDAKEVAVVIGGSSERNIGDIEIFVVRHAQPALPRGFGESYTLAAAGNGRATLAPARGGNSKAQAGIIPGHLRNIGESRFEV